jgi:transcriptional regulator with XRE-family HTH domain
MPKTTKDNLGVSESFGAFVAQKRQKINLSQQQVAQMTGIGRSSLVRIEAASGGIKRSVLERLAAVLEFDIDQGLRLVEADREAPMKKRNHRAVRNHLHHLSPDSSLDFKTAIALECMSITFEANGLGEKEQALVLKHLVNISECIVYFREVTEQRKE